MGEKFQEQVGLEESLDILLQERGGAKWEVDIDGMYLNVQGPAGTFYGYSYDELIGKKYFYDLHLENGRQEFKENFFKMFKKKDCFEKLENIIEMPDGELRYVLTLGTPVFNEEGDLLGRRGIDLDVTKEKLLERDLEMQKKQFEVCINGSNDGIWDWDLKSNSLYFSPKWKSMIGYEDHEITNTYNSFESRLHAEDIDRVLKYVDLHMKKNNLNKKYDITFRFMHRDGNYLWIRSRGIVLKDEFGKPCRMSGSHTDITKTKYLEKDLREKIEELSETSKSLIERNKELECLYAFSELIDRAPLDIESMARSTLEIIPKSFQFPEIARCMIMIEGNEFYENYFEKTEWKLEKDICDKDNVLGKIIVYYVKKKDFLKEEDKLLGLISERFGKFIRRIKSEKKSLEASKQLYHASKLASIGELAASVGHEITNPLTIIIGTVDLLKRRYLNEIKTVLPSINIIKKSCLRIQDILTSLKSFAREDGDNIVAVDMHEMIDQSLMLVEIIYQKENIDIGREYKAALPIVEGSYGKLQQVLMNLLTNARDAFVEKNDGKIMISTQNKDENFILTFSDNGQGIDSSNITKIFESFFTTKSIGDGTGLGLSISSRLISEMNGKIEVESELNKGTTFTITFPLLKNINMPIQEKLIVESDEMILSGTVLVVDDETTLRSIMANIFMKMGLKVSEAEDGQEALLLLEKSKYDYLVTDIRMPKLDGIKLAEIVREKGYANKIVVVSGGIVANEESKIKKKCDAIIKKPFKTIDVFNIMKSIQ